MIEEGGDWDRRNRLKVYEGVYLMTIRDFGRAAKLFNDTVSTFTSVELVDYATFVSYAVFTSALALDRVDLDKKVCNLASAPRYVSTGALRLPMLWIYTPPSSPFFMERVCCMQMIASPEMIEVAQERPIVQNYVRALYDCNYGAFFRALGMLAWPMATSPVYVGMPQATNSAFHHANCVAACSGGRGHF